MHLNISIKKYLVSLYKLCGCLVLSDERMSLSGLLHLFVRSSRASPSTWRWAGILCPWRSQANSCISISTPSVRIASPSWSGCATQTKSRLVALLSCENRRFRAARLLRLPFVPSTLYSRNKYRWCTSLMYGLDQTVEVLVSLVQVNTESATSGGMVESTLSRSMV